MGSTVVTCTGSSQPLWAGIIVLRAQCGARGVIGHHRSGTACEHVYVSKGCIRCACGILGRVLHVSKVDALGHASASALRCA